MGVSIKAFNVIVEVIADDQNHIRLLNRQSIGERMTGQSQAQKQKFSFHDDEICGCTHCVNCVSVPAMLSRFTKKKGVIISC